MSTPAYVILGLLLVLVSIPFAFSLGPIVFGGFLLFLGYRRATGSLSTDPLSTAV